MYYINLGAKKRHLSRKHTTNDSGTEGKYLEHHKRHRSSDSKYFKKEDRKVRERSSEKNHYHSKFKVTNDSDALAESLSTQSKKHIKVKPKEEKNRSSSPER